MAKAETLEEKLKRVIKQIRKGHITDDQALTLIFADFNEAARNKHAVEHAHVDPNAVRTVQAVTNPNGPLESNQAANNGLQ